MTPEQREIFRQIGFTAEQSILFGQSDTLKFIAARAKEALKEIRMTLTITEKAELIIKTFGHEKDDEWDTQIAKAYLKLREAADRVSKSLVRIDPSKEEFKNAMLALNRVLGETE